MKGRQAQYQCDLSQFSTDVRDFDMRNVGMGGTANYWDGPEDSNGLMDRKDISGCMPNDRTSPAPSPNLPRNH